MIDTVSMVGMIAMALVIVEYLKAELRMKCIEHKEKEIKDSCINLVP